MFFQRTSCEDVEPDLSSSSSSSPALPPPVTKASRGGRGGGWEEGESRSGRGRRGQTSLQLGKTRVPVHLVCCTQCAAGGLGREAGYLLVLFQLLSSPFLPPAFANVTKLTSSLLQPPSSIRFSTSSGTTHAYIERVFVGQR